MRRELYEGSYTSPGGDVALFKFEDLTTSFKRNGTAFTFPNADATYVQDVSTTGLSMPITAIFEDPAEADRFTEYLRIPGLGALMHPVKGLRYVVPLGEVKQKDALVSNVNETQITVTFVETVTDAYADTDSPKSDAIQELEGFDSTIDETISATVPPSAGAIREALLKIREVTNKIANAEAVIARDMAAVTQEINNALNTVIGDPVTLFFQAAQLIRQPARVAGLTADKLEAYYTLVIDTANNLTGGSDEDKAFAAGVTLEATAASVEAVAGAKDFIAATEATGSANKLLAIFEVATAFAEDNGGLGQAWSHLYRAVSLIVGHLIRVSFTLLQERTYTAPRDMTILEAVADTYGIDNLDKNLDFLVESNYLTGSEIITIPKGKALKIYE